MTLDKKLFGVTRRDFINSCLIVIVQKTIAYILSYSNYFVGYSREAVILKTMELCTGSPVLLCLTQTS